MAMELRTSSDYAAWVAGSAAAVYFQSPGCGVCTALRPKIEDLLGKRFPQLPLAVVDAGASPDLAAQAGIFSFPALIVVFDGQEFLRKVRNFSLAELESSLERPYLLWQSSGDNV
jgi:thioredoxin-like negative regulator of GroEL